MIADLCILKNISLKQAMRQMDKAGQRILFVVNEQGCLIGTLTDGDIRRQILKKKDLEISAVSSCNTKPFFASDPFDLEEIKQVMVAQKIERVPIVNSAHQVIDVLKWEDIFSGKKLLKETLSIPVMIMAGGRGTRLDLVTRILPKPLVPIGDKTIIDIIIDKFVEHGVTEFFMSIHHKAKLIKAYFEEKNNPYNIQYIEEQKPLGTAGSLRFLRNKIKDTVLVSNCDIIVDCNYSEVYDFHKKSGNDLTIIGSFRHFTIPYGICKTSSGGALKEIIEKPEYDFLVNTGMVLVGKKALRLIPANKEFHITDLIAKIKRHKGKVGVFPVNEKSWIDIGQWEEYRKTMEDFERKI